MGRGRGDPKFVRAILMNFHTRYGYERRHNVSQDVRTSKCFNSVDLLLSHVWFYLRKPMDAGLIILALGWKEVFNGWDIDLMCGVAKPEGTTPGCTFSGWLDGMILLLNSELPGRGDITACGVKRRGVSVGAGILCASWKQKFISCRSMCHIMLHVSEK